MLTVQGIPIFEDNYIWLLRHPKRPQTAIVDPGDAGPVLATIEQQGLEPVAILITHRHWDHVDGIAELLTHYPMPVYGPTRETIPHCSHALSDGEIVELPALDAYLEVLDVPGHTAGHIAYYQPPAEDSGTGLLFCGDSLFTGGCGRLFDGTLEQMHASLQRIRTLPDNTQVYCTHEYTEANLEFARIAEPENLLLQERQQTVQAQRRRGEPTVPALLGLEKATNPFLRSDQPALIRSAEDFAGHPLHSSAEVFTTVRRWKDTLD
jgi:hydroxyacylglutathione hydrolase